MSFSPSAGGCLFEDTKEAIREALAQMELPTALDVTYEQAGADSLDIVQLKLKLEERFKRFWDDEEFFAHKDLPSLICFLTGEQIHLPCIMQGELVTDQRGRRVFTIEPGRYVLKMDP